MYNIVIIVITCLMCGVYLIAIKNNQNYIISFNQIQNKINMQFKTTSNKKKGKCTQKRKHKK